jgi:predicted phosphate transport protein (TIGR00153 family)
MVQFFPMLKGEKSGGFYEETDLFTQEVVKCITHLRETIHHYCDGNHQLAKESAAKVVALEAKADGTRRSIEKKLYTGVIVQMGTEDKYALLEAIDDVADKAEILVRMADVSKLEIPKIITKDLEEMANKIEISAKLLSDAVSGLQSDIETTIKKAKKIEIIREQVRESEFAVLKKLFANQQTVKAVILKDVITLTGGVADKVEEAGDRLISLALKYKS